MDENRLEMREFAGEGCKLLIEYGGWRVAILRYIDELIPDRIMRVEPHDQTVQAGQYA
jgi:hypothetical protein